MKEHINILKLDNSVLQHLATNKEPINDSAGRILTQESRDIFKHGGGYFIDQVIFVLTNEGEDKKYFRFLAITYLDNQKTYTEPYEVFREVEKRTITRYSNWVEEKE